MPIANNVALQAFNNKTTGFSFSITNGITIPVDSLVILSVIADNAFTSNTNMYSVGIGGGGAVSWTLVGGYQNGTANAGTEILIAYGTCTTEIAVGNTITITGQNQFAAKAVSLECFSGVGSVSVVYTPLGAAGTTLSYASSGSFNAGDVCYVAVGWEGTGTITTAETDTTNGTWNRTTTTTQRVAATSGGSALTNQVISSNWKAITGTGGQTYNLTMSTSTDYIGAMLRLVPAAAPADLNTVVVGMNACIV